MTEPKPPPDAVFGEEDRSEIRRALDIPAVIDNRYRVLERVGAGSMGIVLRGEDLFLQRPVAIKVVEPGPQAVDRFLKEAQSLAQVRHENIVQVYACGPLQGSYYLAMELVTGEPLESVIDGYVAAGALFPLDRARRILRAIGQGLEAVHRQKLVHRDIKPGNIMLERDTDRPVLIDFGLARRKSISSPRISVAGGTPSYMAPEQARDPDGSRVTARSDLYSFACTAFELLTGRMVFEGNDIYTVLLAHLNDPAPPISRYRPELVGVDSVFLRALEKDPAKRWGSIGEMLAALDEGTDRTGPPSLPDARMPSVPNVRPDGANDTMTAEPTPLGRCAIVVAADPGLRRSLLRNATQHLKTRKEAIEVAAIASPADAVTLLAASDCRLVVVDEESAEGYLTELVGLARSRGAEIIVISRDFQATAAALGSARVRHLVPKPVNVHVLAAVLGRVELRGAGSAPSGER